MARKFPVLGYVEIQSQTPVVQFSLGSPWETAAWSKVRDLQKQGVLARCLRCKQGPNPADYGAGCSTCAGMGYVVMGQRGPVAIRPVGPTLACSAEAYAVQLDLTTVDELRVSLRRTSDVRLLIGTFLHLCRQHQGREAAAAVRETGNVALLEALGVSVGWVLRAEREETQARELAREREEANDFAGFGDHDGEASYSTCYGD